MYYYYAQCTVVVILSFYSLSVGCSALPQLLRLRNVMVQRQVSDMWSRDELPCEVNLGWDRRYHSVFTCPILRQQSSGEFVVDSDVHYTCYHTIFWYLPVLHSPSVLS